MSPDEIARRLREEGTAQAPPDLAPEVMRQVAREPRKRRRPWPRWRPVAVWATAAAAVAAGGFAISQLGSSASSSAGSASSAALTEPGRAAQAEVRPPSRAFKVASGDADRILQEAGVAPAHASLTAPHHRRIVAAVPRRKVQTVLRQLAAAARNPGPGPKVLVRIVPRR